MPKRMLIDSSHPEETRVVVLDGQKVEEFDFEAATKRPLKGNIYLAKVTRVEPSLQAAFVEYGGNRQGFLAFSEIHPDYYQIPIEDRLALLAETEAEAKRRATEDGEYVETSSGGSQGSESDDDSEDESEEGDHDETARGEEAADAEFAAQESDGIGLDRSEALIEQPFATGESDSVAEDRPFEHHGAGHVDEDDSHEIDDHGHEHHGHDDHSHEGEDIADLAGDDTGAYESAVGEQPESFDGQSEQSVSGDIAPEGEPQPGEPAAQSAPLRQQRPQQRFQRRHRYKIQEVIKRRQIILVQVVKEERGNKGAALTTFMSLAGRYCVLMPNTPRGGGISRKITNVNDRKRLKSAAQSLELPEGMGLIIRTAGESRTKTEIKRDYEYLLRLWDTIRELTLKSNAPACVYEEGDLIKRAIRDLYNKDISEVVVEGDDGYRNAKDFMRMIMPSHAKNVKPYKDPLPLFQRNHIEAQLDAMFSPTVHLKSGGYIVINQTEALVSIDVNSGRATREHSIEETAYKTNLEAADEIARQLRLRDLAGLIVIDFIDMEDGRNDRAVEKRIYNAVKNDRARIQIGKISQFGLLEMSRQRLRAGVVAGSTVPCPHCGGQGIVRSVESTALRVLRGLEEEGQRHRASIITVHVTSDVAVYALNQKRREIARIEAEYDLSIMFEPKNEMMIGTFEILRTGVRAPSEISRPAISVEAGFTMAQLAEEPEADAVEEAEDDEEEIEERGEEEAREQRPQQQSQDGQSQGEGGRRKRRRRRRGGRDREPREGGTEQPAQQNGDHISAPVEQMSANIDGENHQPAAEGQPQAQNGNGEGGRKRRRRRRRGRGGRQEGEFAAQQAGQSPGENGFAHRAENSGADAPREVPAPNAASTPVWSLTPERNERSEPASMKDAKPDSAEPARKGWWQRTFKS